MVSPTRYSTQGSQTVEEAKAGPVSTESEQLGGVRAAPLIIQQLVESNIEFAVTLPDSWMGPLFNELHREPTIAEIKVASEIEGVGICSGTYFGGRGSCLVMPNNGLLLCGYHLSSLSLLHRIPLFMVMALRGKVGDTAFYQEYQGVLTEPMLEVMDISYEVIRKAEDIPLIGEAYRHSRLYRRPAAVLLAKSVLV